jgi:hypothetical protein
MMGFGPDGLLYLSRYTGGSFAGLSIIHPETHVVTDRYPNSSTLGHFFDPDGRHLWLVDGSPTPDVLRKLQLGTGIEVDTDGNDANGITPIALPVSLYRYDFHHALVVTR